MKTLLLVGALALAQLGAGPPRPAAQAVASALGQFEGLSQDAVRLLRRALREPSDTNAQAVLKGPGLARLLARREQVKPTFDRWLRAQTEMQKNALLQKFLHANPLALYADSLDNSPGAKARFQRCPSLKNDVDRVLLTALLY